MTLRNPGVKNVSSGPRKPSACQTIRFDGETMIARLLSRSAISKYPGSGPRAIGGSPSSTWAAPRETTWRVCVAGRAWCAGDVRCVVAWFAPQPAATSATKTSALRRKRPRVDDPAQAVPLDQVPPGGDGAALASGYPACSRESVRLDMIDVSAADDAARQVFELE